MELSLATRVALSLRSLFLGYLSGLLVVQGLRVLPLWPFSLFAFSFTFHALSFLSITFVGWVTFLLPLVVFESPRRRFQKPFSATIAGGVAGSCLVMILLVSLLGRSAFALPGYAPACAGYALCAFVIGSLATGLYVTSRNRKELTEKAREPLQSTTLR